MVIVFDILLLAILYAFMGYPLVLLLRRRKEWGRDPLYEPTVSLVIAAHNEEDVIEMKLKNSGELDYPKDKLEVILADDGSTDKTGFLASSSGRARVLSLDWNGKTAAQNKAVENASGEIIVFSDANAIYHREAIRKLVRNFVDRSVGCVCGELQYKGEKSRENLYWKYEIGLKKLESKSGSLLGANGSIYAVRRNDYITLPVDAMSDFLEPILILKSGMKVIYESEAVAVEDPPRYVFSRKRRIILRSLRSLRYLKGSSASRKAMLVLWLLFSHKILRWIAPFFFVVLLASTIYMLPSPAFAVLLAVQLLLYLSGIFSKTVRYFLSVNAASLLATIDFIRGKRITKWDVQR